MALEEYRPLTEAELDEWEEQAKGPKEWAADYILHLIAEIRRLRKAQVEAQPECPAKEVMPPLSPEERRARVMAAAGSMAHLPGSVDEFLQRKQEEIDLEEERWERRQQGRKP
jgi:hypothetical protein